MGSNVGLSISIGADNSNNYDNTDTAYCTTQVYGRDMTTRDIYDDLLGFKYHAIEVSGEPGIGKTTICSTVLDKFIAQNKGMEVFYFDLSGQSNKDFALSLILKTMGIEQREPSLERLFDSHSPSKGSVLYFDNLEDPLCDENFKLWFIDYIRNKKHRVLYSTRTHIAIPSIKHYPLPPLGELPSIDMFEHLWINAGGNKFDRTSLTLKLLMEKLEQHPLSIVLVATQAYRFADLSEVLREWNTASKYDTMAVDGQGRHKSLITAVAMSYDAIKNKPEAVELWAVIAILEGNAANSFLERLFECNTYMNARNTLKQNSLITLKGNDIHMLSPLLDLVFTFSKDSSLEERIFNKIYMELHSIFLNTKDLKNQKYLEFHRTALSNLNNLLTVLNRNITCNKYLLAVAAVNYFQYNAYSSVNVLLSILEKDGGGLKSKAVLYNVVGDLERRLGQIDGAKAHYSQAEILFRDEQDDLGLANVLQSMGDLERRLGHIDGAKAHYSQAEKLYRDEQANLGLANVLKSMGDLERRLGHIDGAKAHYSQAEKLFRDEQDNLGLAYVCAELAVLYNHDKTKDKAREYALQAIHYGDLCSAPDVMNYVMKCIEKAKIKL